MCVNASFVHLSSLATKDMSELPEEVLVLLSSSQEAEDDISDVSTAAEEDQSDGDEKYNSLPERKGRLARSRNRAVIFQPFKKPGSYRTFFCCVVCNARPCLSNRVYDEDQIARVSCLPNACEECVRREPCPACRRSSDGHSISPCGPLGAFEFLCEQHTPICEQKGCKNKATCSDQRYWCSEHWSQSHEN